VIHLLGMSLFHGGVVRRDRVCGVQFGGELEHSHISIPFDKTLDRFLPQQISRFHHGAAGVTTTRT
jgi:hypothetical protein